MQPNFYCFLKILSFLWISDLLSLVNSDFDIQELILSLLWNYTSL